MTNQQTLEQAIQEVTRQGWSPLLISGERIYFEISDNATRVKFGYKMEDRNVPIVEWSAFGLIFNHDFAKALWGEEPYGFEGTDVMIEYPSLEWQHHLQQMVLSDDPIKYLGENM